MQLLVIDASHPGPAHIELATAQHHGAALAAVAVGGPVHLVVLALRPGHVGDLGLHHLDHDLEADGHGGGEQSFAHAGGEQRQLLAHLAGQSLGERLYELRIVQVDEPDPGQDRQAGAPGWGFIRAASCWWCGTLTCWWSSVSARLVVNPEPASRQDRGGGPPHQVPRGPGQPRARRSRRGGTHWSGGNRRGRPTPGFEHPFEPGSGTGCALASRRRGRQVVAIRPKAASEASEEATLAPAALKSYCHERTGRYPAGPNGTGQHRT